mmetsp:Transcript_8101/g.20202  ORF Transcript_8101/g.20202 Transcript_8101/m.20202 type:complete len:225 (-) Transcript_8101:545-1219(-)
MRSCVMQHRNSSGTWSSLGVFWQFLFCRFADGVSRLRFSERTLTVPVRPSGLNSHRLAWASHSVSTPDKPLRSPLRSKPQSRTRMPDAHAPPGGVDEGASPVLGAPSPLPARTCSPVPAVAVLWSELDELAAPPLPLAPCDAAPSPACLDVSVLLSGSTRATIAGDGQRTCVSSGTVLSPLRWALRSIAMRLLSFAAWPGSGRTLATSSCTSASVSSPRNSRSS